MVLLSCLTPYLWCHGMLWLLSHSFVSGYAWFLAELCVCVSACSKGRPQRCSRQHQPRPRVSTAVNQPCCCTEITWCSFSKPDCVDPISLDLCFGADSDGVYNSQTLTHCSTWAEHQCVNPAGCVCWSVFQVCGRGEGCRSALSLLSLLSISGTVQTQQQSTSTQQLRSSSFHSLLVKMGLCSRGFSSERWRHQMSNTPKSATLFFTALSKNSFSFMVIF